jgi:hypothetical protein
LVITAIYIKLVSKFSLLRTAKGVTTTGIHLQGELREIANLHAKLQHLSLLFDFHGLYMIDVEMLVIS